MGLMLTHTGLYYLFLQTYRLQSAVSLETSSMNTNIVEVYNEPDDNEDEGYFTYVVSVYYSYLVQGRTHKRVCNDGSMNVHS